MESNQNRPSDPSQGGDEGVLDKAFRSKTGLLALAKQLRNVTRACKEMGFSRDSFYRFQELYKSGGEASLERSSRGKPILQNRVEQHVEDAIVDLALRQPAWGQERVATKLREQGMIVSPGGVRRVWQRHRIETAKKRREALAARSRGDEPPAVNQQQAAAEDQAPLKDGLNRALESGQTSVTGAHLQRHVTKCDINKPKLYQVVNVASMVAIAIIACLLLVPWGISTIKPSSYGDFGMSFDSNWRIVEDPRSPADKANLKAGDIIRWPQRLHDRLTLARQPPPEIDEQITIEAVRDGRRRMITLRAAPLSPMARSETISQLVLVTSLSCWLVIGALLVLVRPSKITWGFYLAATSLIQLFSPNYAAPKIPDSWAFIFSSLLLVLTVAGVFGFLMFCLRFPTNKVAGWRKIADGLAPASFISLAVLTVSTNTWPIYPTGAEYAIWSQVFYNLSLVVLLVIVALGLASLVGQYRSSTGLKRERIKWVLFGVICASIGFLTWALFAVSSSFGSPPISPPLAQTVGGAPLIVLPLTVAYAVIRHRVIDVRFVVNRALLYGTIALFAGALIVLTDWLFSTRFTNSRIQTAVYAGIALLVGLSLNAARHRITAIIDRWFFHEWHRTELQANLIGDTIHRATSRTDLYQHLTAGIANAYSLASVALFEQLTDGGFVRVAAYGWPPGALWHILPADAIAKRAPSLRLVDVDSFGWGEQALPAGVARPSLMIPIIAGKKAPAMLLCGAHDNGTGLDPDEIRMIRRLCADAGLVYGSSGPQESEKLVLRLRQNESLSK